MSQVCLRIEGLVAFVDRLERCGVACSTLVVFGGRTRCWCWHRVVVLEQGRVYIGEGDVAVWVWVCSLVLLLAGLVARFGVVCPICFRWISAVLVRCKCCEPIRTWWWMSKEDCDVSMNISLCLSLQGGRDGWVQCMHGVPQGRFLVYEVYGLVQQVQRR